jgi:DNA-binding HxlR family transcriptional regulator
VARRSYRQYCALARALDVVGERWTLLLVRELLLGPRRFTELLEGLPGISRNLLAARLRELEEHRLVHRRLLAPPARGVGWELSPAGRRLEPAVLALGRFGAYLLATPAGGDAVQAGWFVVSLRASFRPERAPRRLRATYEIRLDGEAFSVAVVSRTVETRRAPSADPDAVIATSLDTFVALLSRSLTPAQALARGDVELTGPTEALDRFVDLFAWELSDGPVSGEPTAAPARHDAPDP